MGVVRRQSIKQSIVNYLAVGVAALSTIFIYPRDTEIYGLARFVIDTSLLFVPFVLLGFGGVAIRFFPHFKNPEKQHHGFLFFLLAGVGGGSLLLIGLFFLFRGSLYGLYEGAQWSYRQYLPLLVPLAILMAFLQLFYNYSSNFQRIAIPAIFQNLIKLTLPLIILLYLSGWISSTHVVYGILASFLLALLGNIFYVKKLGQLHLGADYDFFKKFSFKEVRNFATFSLFNHVGSALAFRIDTFMIATLIDFQNTGVFAIAAFIANTIAIPTNAVNQIAGPIITEALKNNQLAEVKKLYQSSSINLLIIGLLLFVCIIASIDDLLSMMSKQNILAQGGIIVALIGLAKVIDMGTSINNQIINYSKHYRFGFVAIIFMAIFNIVMNLIFIPKLQIVGAALATLCSLAFYNLIKLLFIQWKFKFQPFTVQTLRLLLIAGGSYGLVYLLPTTASPVLDILIKSFVIILVYLPLVYYGKISPDFRHLVEEALKKIGWR